MWPELVIPTQAIVAMTRKAFAAPVAIFVDPWRVAAVVISFVVARMEAIAVENNVFSSEQGVLSAGTSRLYCPFNHMSNVVNGVK
jgi:hypothetical protein